MATGQLEGALHDQEPATKTDPELLHAYADRGSEEDFRSLVERHGKMVRRICLRQLDNDHDADEAFQEIFTVLACKARSARPIKQPELLKGWLCGTALRVTRKARTKAWRRAKRESNPQPKVQPLLAVNPTDPLELEELKRVLDDELGKLPAKFRVPLVLIDMEGMTHDEAARILNRSRPTVTYRVLRARELLKGRLTRRGIAPCTGLVAAVLSTGTASAAVPPTLLDATVRAASSPDLKAEILRNRSRLNLRVLTFIAILLAGCVVAAVIVSQSSIPGQRVISEKVEQGRPRNGLFLRAQPTDPKL